jgi:hypothetical protein
MIDATVSALWVANCGIDARALRQHLLGAGHVVQVGHRLAGEDRIIVEAALLGALDLRVPIGALHEAHHELPVMALGHGRDGVDHRARALLVGLDGKAEALPVRQRGSAITASITSSESSSRSASSASTVKLRS